MAQFNMQSFAQPEAAYRIHPFWFWNGEMDDEQIRYQIDEMKDKGLGGFFICARQGLQVPYLSDAWFKKVRVAVEAAERRNLNVWLYDEYPYPSGIAGGEVTLEHPEAKHYTLEHQAERVQGGGHLSMELPWARIVYAKAIPVTPEGDKLWNEAVDVRSAIGNFQAEPIFQKAGLTAYNQKRFFTYRTVQKIEWTAPAGDWEVLIVQEKEIEDFKYYGTFVDPCNHEAMATFIRLTHDKYAQHLGEYFGGTIKGIFTDEIGLLGSIPWSPKLPQFFLERNGYDLRDHLHALLYEEADQAARIRYDYYQAIHELLLGAYHKQVHDWCEQHGLEYVTEVPSVRHTTQRYSHVPGGDTAHEKLGRSLDWILNNQAESFRSSAKMVSSIARQFGRERNLIECFHSVGWSMTLQDAKWMIDRMAAQGTNFFNFHAFFYTLDALMKHDAPPSQFLQNPYWAHFKQLGDYVGRISYVMSCGQADIKVAVLQPTTSLWAHMGNPFHHFDYGGKQPDEKRKLGDLKAWWTRICNELTYSGRDYDHLDAELLGEATVENGLATLSNASYSIIIVPPMTNLESGAWGKLEAFLAQGGVVISMGQLPYQSIQSSGWNASTAADIFGLPQAPAELFWSEGSEAALQWFKGEASAYHLPFSASAEASSVLSSMSTLLEELQPLTVKLEPDYGGNSILMQTRRIDEDSFLVFVSNQEESVRDLSLQVSAALWGASDALAVQFTELSLDRGDETAVEALQANDRWTLPLYLGSYESRLFRLTRSQSAAVAAESKAWNWVVDASEAALWSMQTEGDNAIRLDAFKLSLQGVNGSQSEADGAGDLVQVKTFIDQCADLAASTKLPVQMSQLFGTPMQIRLAYPLQARYTTTIVVDEMLDRVHLVMDQGALSGEGSIVINGHRLQKQEFERFFLYDYMNVGCDITPYIQQGTNEIAVDVAIEQDWNGLIDALYITGAFQTGFDAEQRPVLKRPVAQKQPLTAGPYAGYPYFAGTMSFSRELQLDDLPASDSFELTFEGLDPQFHEVAEVWVNGQSLGARAWMPYRFRGQTSELVVGTNHVEVRVTNTLIGLLEGKYFDYARHELKPVSTVQMPKVIS
ncbi:glycosyl hydrolase [Paenibacillus sp. UNC451MF]|uniref:glycosyl hydrolase n=1 Tax=Paenibacillus sp. UNC451MF TaxID=1449063 RepID=UPI00049087B8|nr:glycosyl hydrolase [Paenibacillus sp. UNC451MF]